MKIRFLKKTAIGFLCILTLLVYLLLSCANPQKQHTPASQQRFEDIERWVKIFEDPKRDEWQKPEEVVQFLNLKPGDVIADIGAGTGYFTRRFAVSVGSTGKALGLDVEPSMVQYMEEDAAKLNLINYKAKLVKPDDPDLKPHSVDIIFLCNTYHHIENRVDYFKKISKNLKTNGRLVIVDFYKDMDFGPPRDHKLAKDVVLKEMKQAGYHLKKDLKFLPYQYYLEFKQ